jgi:beta-lactamase superfamily II metal-dependent hydrolase
MSKQCINVDLADVFEKRGRKGFIRSLAWGDEVDVVEAKSTHLVIRTKEFIQQTDGSILPKAVEAFIEPSKASGIKAADVVIPRSKNRVLRVNFVDVQQGDGSVIETPDGKVILVDGGDNQLFARYLAARFTGTTESKPKDVECILVTHGDADHFAGLTQIFKSETNKTPKKRLFIAPKRVYHNGLVKRPSTEGKKKVPDIELLGPTKFVDGETILTGLESNLLTVPDSEMNVPFLAWKNALKGWNKRGKIAFRRLSFGDDDAFDFIDDAEIEVKVLGPILVKKGSVSGLTFLGKPPRGPRIGQESLNTDNKGFSGFSASHTINGHSIVFRLKYGGFSYLFTGDLNDQSSRILAREHNKGTLSLRSEVFKVPHHGSADFSGGFIERVSPLISVVSSGDESAKKEHIHPRSTIMGALGKHSRVNEPLVFVTELVAFFNLEGFARLTDTKKDKTRGEFFSFSRTNFGIVKTRTNGQRMLVYTDSGKADMKEAYAYQLDDNAVPLPSPVLRV